MQLTATARGTQFLHRLHSTLAAVQPLTYVNFAKQLTKPAYSHCRHLKLILNWNMPQSRSTIYRQFVDIRVWAQLRKKNYIRRNSVPPFSQKTSCKKSTCGCQGKGPALRCLSYGAWKRWNRTPSLPPAAYHSTQYKVSRQARIKKKSLYFLLTAESARKCVPSPT